MVSMVLICYIVEISSENECHFHVHNKLDGRVKKVVKEG